MPRPAPALSDRPRVLLITPDYPPRRGGIQVLAHRIATLATRIHVKVVTTGGPGGRGGEPGVVRVGGHGRRDRLVRLSARALVEGGRWADAVISGHVVCAPSAAVLRSLRRVAVVQYFYGQEIPHRSRLSAFAARRSDCNVAISRYTTSLLSHVTDPARIVQIPPGVDLPRAPGRHPREASTIVTVGRLRDPYKGHDVLLRAMAILAEARPDARLTVVGDGPLRPRLERLARQLGVDGAVTFAGEVADEERDRILDRARIFCMPSRLREDGAGEGFGIVYMEAGARGLPVVAGAVGGATDAVVHGETGLLVDPEDAAAVASALRGLLDDPRRASAMGAAGMARAATFAWPAIVARVEDVVLDLLAARR